MTLCEKRKLDKKNRIQIPVEMIRSAGGELDCPCYVMHDERTNYIMIVFEESENMKTVKDTLYGAERGVII